MKRKTLLMTPHHWKKLRFQVEGSQILTHLDTELFPRVFGWNIQEFENDLRQMTESLKTKKDVFTGKLRIKSHQEIQKSWGKKRILSWNKQNLDLNFMNNISMYFRINEKDNHLGLESLKIGLFKMIVFFRKEDTFLISKIYDFLGTELNELETFRRMLTLSKQFYQVLIENIKDRLRYSKKTPKGLFENSKSGEYEKTFDYMGYYGINPEKIITKEHYPFYIVQNSGNNPFTQPFYSKYSIHSKIMGLNECRSRGSPRLHFPAERFSDFIEKSNYMNLIKSRDFIKTLSSNGLNLNRVLSVVLVLGLEEETWKLELAEEDIHYLGKVLYKNMFPHQLNHLPWIETSERHFLERHYKEKYTTHLQVLLSKLPSMSFEISQKSLPAAYPVKLFGHFEGLDEVKNSDLLVERMMKMDQVSKLFEDRPQLRDLDEISPSNLSEKISQLEAHS
ncbi:hypothetical protein VP01_527g2 [Puccinia sorghi]|uniref:Uncharacterized protein n=1 Tax=Puccinia sorghi TaxID=27349 RepID=A0A0L6UL46_9BASI|nr:hypothetical protein VP01_527g2 [Puccinia sorghi]